MFEDVDPTAQAIDKHLETARFFLTGSQWNRCADAARKILNIDPNHAEGHAILAICYARLDDPKQAREEADLALAQDSTNKYYYYASSIAARSGDDFVRAEADVRAGMSLDAECNYLHHEMYRVYSGQGRWIEARPYMRYALHLSPERADYHLEMARVSIVLKDGEEADRQITETLRLDPENAEAHKFLGLREIDKKRLAQGVSALRSSLVLDPTDTIAQNRLRITEVRQHPFFRPYDLLESQLTGLNSNWQILARLTPFLGVIAVQTRLDPGKSDPRVSLFPYAVFLACSLVLFYMFVGEEILRHHAVNKPPAATRRIAMALIGSATIVLHLLYWF